MSEQLKQQNNLLDSVIKSIYDNFNQKIEIESVVFISPQTQQLEKFRLIVKKKNSMLSKFILNEPYEYIRNRVGSIIYFDSYQSIIMWLMTEYSSSNGFLLEKEIFIS